LEAVEKVASEGVKVAFLKIGESRIELLEPLHETSPIQRVIDKRGEGIHHIALEVDQINKRLEHYKQSGVRLINEEAKQGAHNSQIAFIHPKASYAVLYEMCQHMGGADEYWTFMIKLMSYTIEEDLYNSEAEMNVSKNNTTEGRCQLESGLNTF